MPVFAGSGRLSLSAADKPKTETIRGKLIVRAGRRRRSRREHQTIQLDGYADPQSAARSTRQWFRRGSPRPLHGARAVPGRPPTHALLLVHEDGKLKMITYWCDVCYIRAYAPGPCVCCQKDTDVELKELDDIR